MLLQSVFTDTQGPGNLIIVSILKDQLGDLKLSGSKMVIDLQEPESLLKTVSLRLLVSNLIKYCVQVHANSLKEEHIFIGKRPILLRAEERKDTQKFLMVDTGVLHGIKNVEFPVAVNIERRVQTLLILQQIAFADKTRLTRVEQPEEMIFIGYLHVFIFGFDEGFRDTNGTGETDGVGIFSIFMEEDAGVAVRDHHFQAMQKFSLDLVETGAGIEIVDYVVDHQECIFFHESSPFLQTGFY